MSQTRQYLIQLDFKPTLATEDALAAARVIIQQLEQEQIAWALAGGVAMHSYGFARATQDVDMRAERLLQLTPKQPLSLGGQSYVVPMGEKEVLVGVIVRDDFFRNLYEAALRDTYEGENGWRVLTPEWLAILKFQSGRSKDQIDLLWLLSRPALVDRELLHAHLTEMIGETGAEFALRGLQDFYQRAWARFSTAFKPISSVAPMISTPAM